jgi:iron complex outermembrane receptor protein
VLLGSLPLQSVAQTAAGPETAPIQLPAMVSTGEWDPVFEKPVQITRLTGDELEKRGVDELPDLQSVLPNSIARSGGTRSLNDVFGFRGVVNNAFYGEPAVSLYVDDVPYAMTLSYDAAILDVDHIDIYRGPQFTRFGRRGATGVISIYSREPGDRLTVDGTAGFASYDEQYYKLSIQAPLGSEFSVSLSGLYSRRDGYLRNDLLELRPDFADAFTGRFSLQWKPTKEWNVQLIIGGQRFDDGVQRWTNLDSTPFVIDHDFSGMTDGSSDVQALRIRYEGEAVNFTSVTARRDFRVDPGSFDLDFTQFPFARVSVVGEVLQYSQELRLESAAKGDFQWFLGAYASWTQQDLEVDDTTPLLGDSDLKDKAFAIYGEATRKLGKHLDVTLGLRGDYIRKSADRDLTLPDETVSTQAVSRTITNFSPKLQFNWHFNDDVFAYVNTALSYRPGVYSVFNASPEILSADTERTWANEIGAKARFLEDKLELSLAGFWYEIDDYQIEHYQLSGFGVFTADHVVSRGVELELVARPIAGLELSAAVGYTNVRFTNHHDAVTGEDLSGRRPPYIPDVTASFTAQFTHSTGVMARLEWLLTGRCYFDEGDSKAYAQNSYGLLNARIGYEREHWGVYLYGKNLTSTEYYTTKLFPYGVGIIGEPRVLGVMATFRF